MKMKKEKWTRREFFHLGLSSLAGIGFLARRPKESRHRYIEIQPTAPGSSPVQRKLGKTGISLPIVSLGVMNADHPDLVRRAFELGIRHFDTAHGYQRGRNEEMIGKVIQELRAREKVIIATKAMNPSQREGKSAAQIKQDFIEAVEQSLRRLRSDYVDILYAHDIKTAAEVSHPGLQEALSLLKEQKKTRWVGFSTHTNMARCLDEAVRTRFYDVVLTSFNYALADDEALLASLERAAKAGLGLIAMKTQCSQYWYRDSLPRSQQRYYEGQILHSALLKWVLHHDFITTAIPGCTTFAQLETDWCVASDPAYTQEEESYLRNRRVRIDLAYCVQCSECIPTCPRGVDIPSLMRTHMYLTCYQNPSLATQTLEGIGQGRGIQTCADCPSCRAVCSRGLPLTSRIEDLKRTVA